MRSLGCGLVLVALIPAMRVLSGRNNSEKKFHSTRLTVYTDMVYTDSMTRASDLRRKHTTTGNATMETYQTGKCYDNQGQLTQSGVTVTISEDRVSIGASTYPISEVVVDRKNRTIESPNGWQVTY